MLVTHLLLWGLVGFSQAQVIGATYREQDQLRFQCTRELVSMLGHSGPLFFEHGVMFSSLTARDGTGLLVLQTSESVYAARLRPVALNRMQVWLPRERLRLFISYFHNYEVNRRYFEFALGSAGLRSADDYRVTSAFLAPHLKEHLDHLLLEQIAMVSTAALEGRVKPRDVRSCTRLASVNVLFARYSRRQLAAISLMAGESSRAVSRMPANEGG